MSDEKVTESPKTTTPLFANKLGNDENVPAAIVETSAEPEAKPASDSVRYASPTISRLKVGRFQFENGILDVKAADVEAFDKLLESSSPRTKAAVQKVDIAAGDAVARKFLNQQRGPMIRGGDHTGNAPPAPTPGETESKAEQE